MKKQKFERLPQFDDENDLMKLKIGDSFLYGSRMIEQLSNKNEGQEVSYYKVLNKTNYSIEYIPIFDTIDKGDEK